jgi:hypothetical protein
MCDATTPPLSELRWSYFKTFVRMYISDKIHAIKTTDTTAEFSLKPEDAINVIPYLEHCFPFHNITKLPQENMYRMMFKPEYA